MSRTLALLLLPAGALPYGAFPMPAGAVVDPGPDPEPEPEPEPEPGPGPDPDSGPAPDPAPDYPPRAEFTARQIIETARDRHPRFTREKHPDRVLLRALSQEERRMVGRILQANPSAIAFYLTIELADFDFENGYYLPAHHLIHGVDVYPKTAGCDCPPFPAIRCNWHNRLDARFPYSFAVHGNHLHLARTAEHWKDVERIIVSYVPIPIDLHRLDDVLVMPDNAEVYLVAYLASFMATREKDFPLPEKQDFRQERLESEKDLLAAWQHQSVVRIIRRHGGFR